MHTAMRDVTTRTDESKTTILEAAVTRARETVILAGSAESVRAAVERPVTRSSGLRELLWA